MKDNLLIHIHGFLSANNADRVVALQTHVSEHQLNLDVISPQLPENPQPAMETLEKIIQQEITQRQSITLVGYSLGGYFATWLASRYKLRTVLVNPIVRGYDIMCEFFGECYNPHTDVKFSIGEQDIEFLISIYLETLPDPELFLVMLQLGDEITDPKDALEYYAQCELLVEDGGTHEFEHFEKHLETVFNFLYPSGC